MSKKTIFIFLYAFFIVACKNDKADTVTVSDMTGVVARIVDKGDPAVDGCGWHIISDSGIDYMPNNLDAAFQQDNLEVIISFTIDGKLSCSWYLNEFPAINLTSIKKK